MSEQEIYTRELAVQGYELAPYSTLGRAGLALLLQLNDLDRAIKLADDDKVKAILVAIKNQEAPNA